MTLAEKLRMLRGRHAFPETHTIAEFRYWSQLIALDDFPASQFQDCNSAQYFSNSRRLAGVIFHEITHWVDLTATVWGRTFLNKIYNTYPVLDRLTAPGSERDFHRFISLYDEARRLMLPRYYRVVEGSGPVEGALSDNVEITSGVEFDPMGKQNEERPLLLVRIGKSDGTRFVRQPLTAGALLEANAIWAEIATGLEIAETKAAGEDAVEKALVEREIRDILRSPELTEYTAPVRLLSFYSRITNPLKAYEFCATVAQICLNLTEAHFRRIRHPELMNVWGERNKHWKMNRNCAFAFAAICIAAGELRNDEALYDWVERGLKRVNLPSLDRLRSDAIDAMRKVKKFPASAYSATGNYLLEAGLVCAELRMQTGSSAITPTSAIQHELPLPPMIDANMEVASFGFSSFDVQRYDCDRMVDLDFRLDRQIENFRSACR